MGTQMYPKILSFNDGVTVQCSQEFWEEKGLDKFDMVRAVKLNRYGIIFYGEMLSEEEKAKLPQLQETNVAEAKSEFDVILKSYGSEKLKVVRAVKDFVNLGLRESMDLVSNAPSEIKTSVSKDEAEMLKTQLEELGAEVELK